MTQMNLLVIGKGEKGMEMQTKRKSGTFFKDDLTQQLSKNMFVGICTFVLGHQDQGAKKVSFTAFPLGKLYTQQQVLVGFVYAYNCVHVNAITGSPSSKYKHRRALALLRNIQNIRLCMGKKPIISVTYENERISIKNSLPYLKCVLRR